ncbi:MAG: TauD/TfdA family dioxygenase [Proteobacteria bacterium]|nr:TauD/TfdA family dioxygenase [Pseudomonadota bacterium]
MVATVTPFPEGFGAEISGLDLSKPLSGEDRAIVYDAFLDHHLISIPGQSLSPGEAVTAAGIFGDDLEPHLFKHFHHPKTPLIMVLSNRTEDDGQGGKKPKGMADAGSFWHTDLSYKPNPAKATMLYALEIPLDGGDTLFCNLTAAYEALTDAMKKRLDGLRAVHNYAYVPRDVFTSGKVTPPPDCSQPLIRTHPETGRKAIYISPFYMVRIEGLAEDDSEALKKEIYDHCLQDRFRMEYKWRTGDVLAWDNAALMHSATTKTLDPSKHRTLWRATISGEPAF